MNKKGRLGAYATLAIVVIIGIILIVILSIISQTFKQTLLDLINALRG